jgi:hypothetical protein
LATAGTIAPLGDLGGVGTEQAFGNASPFLAPLIEAATGNDLQTGAAIKDAQGNPIKGNAGDVARFLGAQAAGFVPPLTIASSLLQGGRKPAATSIPLLGFQPKARSNAGPLLQQPTPPGWLGALNSVLPFHVGLTNEHADEFYGNKDLRTRLVAEIKANNKALAKTPGGIAKIEAEATRIGNHVTKNLAYYQAHPEALRALLANGTAK